MAATCLRHTVLFALTLFAIPIATSTALALPESGHGDAADAIAALAKNGAEVDARQIGQQLKLPGLLRPSGQWSANSLEWIGPESYSAFADFIAKYTPENSELGITGISLGWMFRPGKGATLLLTTLEVAFKPGHCPSRQRLDEAMNVKPLVIPLPGRDGARGFVETTYFVPQGSGEPVQVSFTGDNTCALGIRHQRMP